AKRKLFTELEPENAVINLDDPYGARLAAEVRGPITFGLVSERATYRATNLETGIGGSRFAVHGPDGTIELASPLRGTFNVYNVLAALATVRALGVPLQTASDAIKTAGQVPGRFE